MLERLVRLLHITHDGDNQAAFAGAVIEIDKHDLLPAATHQLSFEDRERL